MCDVRTYPFPRIGVVCQSHHEPRRRLWPFAMPCSLAIPEPRFDFSTPLVRRPATISGPSTTCSRGLRPMVVVGGRNSNNTRELVTKCQSAGKPTYHVQNAEELQPEWFAGRECVGLAAGTSTLDATLDAVENRIREFTMSLSDLA